MVFINGIEIKMQWLRKINGKIKNKKALHLKLPYYLLRRGIFCFCQLLQQKVKTIFIFAPILLRNTTLENVKLSTGLEGKIKQSLSYTIGE